MNNTLTTGNGTYTIYTFTGKVLSTGKNMETKVHGGGGGGATYGGTGGSAPVRITSTTVVHDQIFLQDAGGKERALQLQDFNIACREGNIMTALWMIKNGENQGPYVVMHNHTTDQTFYQEALLKKIFILPAKVRMKWGAIICGVIGFAGGLGGAFGGAMIGAGLGYIVKVWNSKGIAEFKSQLNFPEPMPMQQNTIDTNGQEIKNISEGANQNKF